MLTWVWDQNDIFAHYRDSMGKKYVLMLTFIFISFLSKAQLNSADTPSPEEVMTMLPSKLFVQLASSIKTSSFTPAFAKNRKSFLLRAKNTSDGAGIARKIDSLAGFIKSDMYKNNFSKASLTKEATVAKNGSQVAVLLKEVESGLKPEGLTDVWKMQRTNWLADIDKLK